MRSGEFHKSRSIFKTGFRKRISRSENQPADAATPSPEEAAAKMAESRRTNLTRAFANILEAIGAIGFCGALYLFFRDKALALRTLIGSSISAGLGVAMNLAITITAKLRAPRKTP